MHLTTILTTLLLCVSKIAFATKPISGGTDINYCYKKTGRNIQVNSITYTNDPPATLNLNGTLVHGELNDAATCRYSGFYGSTLLFRVQIAPCDLPGITCPVGQNGTVATRIPTPRVPANLARGLRVGVYCVDADRAELLCLKGYVYAGDRTGLVDEPESGADQEQLLLEGEAWEL